MFSLGFCWSLVHFSFIQHVTELPQGGTHSSGVRNLAENKTKSLPSGKLPLVEYARQEMSKVTSESDSRFQVGNTQGDVTVRRREGREKGSIASAWVSHPHRTKAWKQEWAEVVCRAGQSGFLEWVGEGSSKRGRGRSHSQVVKGLTGMENGSNLFSAQRDDTRVFFEKERGMIWLVVIKDPSAY